MRQLARAVLALCAVAVLASVVLLVFRYQNNPTVITVLAVAPLAWSALAAVYLWWAKERRDGVERGTTPEQAVAAADWLAGETAKRWREEAAARKIVTPAPASVRWRWAPGDLSISPAEAAVAPPPGTGPPPFPDSHRPGEILSSGVVTRLHDEVYARLPYGRLALTGGPGVGKTGAMIMLLLAALEWRAAQNDISRPQVPVPVWLPLGGWDPVAESLAEWVTGVLNRDYPALRASRYGAGAAGHLVRTGRVALFLDGFDELPAGLRAEGLRRVNAEAGALRVVLTSRPAEFRLALHDLNLDHCAVIELRPVRAEAAAAYLLRGQAGTSRERWERVAAHLRSNPGGTTAKALNNPLTLSMARDAYATSDPAPLIDPDRFATVESFSSHLISQFLVTAYPDAEQRAHAIDWLGWIARNLGTEQDLRWWDIPRWVPGWQLRAARGVLAALVTWPVVTLLAWLTYRSAPHSPGLAPGGIAIWAVPGISLSLGAALLTGLVIKVEGGAMTARGRTRGQWLRGLLLFLGGYAAVNIVTYLVTAAVFYAPGVLPPALALMIIFAIVLLLRRKRRGHGTRPVPLLEAPAARVVTGALAAACPMMIWTGLVGGPGNVVPAAFTSALVAIILGAVFARLWRGPHSGRLSEPWALAPHWPQPAWIAPLWLVTFPLAIPRWITDWVTVATDAPFATPASTYQTDRRACAIYASGYSMMFIAPACIAVAVLARHSSAWGALAIGWLAAGMLVIWWIAWLCSGQVPLLTLTQVILYPRRGRISFARLLDDARRRQVLR